MTRGFIGWTRWLDGIWRVRAPCKYLIEAIVIGEAVGTKPSVDGLVIFGGADCINWSNWFSRCR
jgi:hypothetical protein